MGNFSKGPANTLATVPVGIFTLELRLLWRPLQPEYLGQLGILYIIHNLTNF